MTATTKPKLKLWPRQMEGAQPVPAFDSQGVTYYHFPNDFQARYKRVMAAMDVYKELEFNSSKDDLNAYFEAQKAAARKIRDTFKLKGGVFDMAAAHDAIVKFDQLTVEFQKRVNWITNIDLLYKLASVLYFDESEDPYSFDPVYAAEKVTRWKADKEIPAFFFSKPIADFLPYSEAFKTDSRLFTDIQKIQQEGKSSLLELLSSMLSTSGSNKDVINYLQSQAALKPQTASSERP